MIAGSLARRYARALLELGKTDGAYERYGREVSELAALYASSAELRLALGDTVIPALRRRAVLEAILDRAQVSKLCRSFALLLLQRERIGALQDIARELDQMVDAQAGRVRAEVTSARPLAAAEVAQLKRILEAATGKVVVLAQKTDPELLGGAVTQLGDTVYDGSIRTQLELLRERFLA